MDKTIVYQATKTIANGLAWNFNEGVIQHRVEKSSKTLCGKSTKGGSSFGWMPIFKNEKTEECPICQKMSQTLSL